ncbi:MAG: pyridoxamine 5'-phosphate oxidase [Paludibacter sp.]
MLREIRKQYEIASLEESDADKSAFNQFQKWLNDALKSSETEPTAMVVSTVDENLQPHSRVVLLKEFDEHGLVFFSNYESNKAQQISINNRIAVLFFWETLERQVRITGTVEKVPEAVSINYFNSRPLDSRIGAYASPQSRVIASKKFLENRFEVIKLQYGENVPKPELWGGYLIIPETVEFWQGRPNRLHDRLFYKKTDTGNWEIVRLAP